MKRPATGPGRARARGRSTTSRLCALGLLAALPGLVSATVVSTTVAGTADIYLAGQPADATLGSDTSASNAPTQVGGLTLVAGDALKFTAAGVTGGAGCTSTGPDGCGKFGTSAANDISGYSGPAQALIGLFLGADEPTSAAAGMTSGTSFGTLAPGLGVVFFIGDGLTGHGTGSAQSFTVPTGAMRLYLATSDSVGNAYNNTGVFAVAVDDGLAAPALGVPEPGTIGLVLAGAVGVVTGQRRRLPAAARPTAPT